MKFKIGQKVRVLGSENTQKYGYWIFPKVGSVVEIDSKWDESKKLYSILTESQLSLVLSEDDLTEITSQDVEKKGEVIKMKFKIGQKVRVVSNDKTKSLGYQMHPKIGSIVKITGYDTERKLYLVPSGLIDLFVSDEDLEEIKGHDIGDVWENHSYEYEVVHSFEHGSKKDTKVVVIQRREFGKDDLEYFTENRYIGKKYDVIFGDNEEKLNEFPLEESEAISLKDEFKLLFSDIAFKKIKLVEIK